MEIVNIPGPVCAGSGMPILQNRIEAGRRYQPVEEVFPGRTSFVDSMALNSLA
jgi:hypothetical protein